MGNHQTSQLSYLESMGYRFFKKGSTSSIGSFEIYRNKADPHEKVMVVTKNIHRSMYNEITPELFFIAQQYHSWLFIQIHVQGSNFLAPLPERDTCCSIKNPDMHSFRITLQYQEETLKSFLRRRNGGLSFQEVKLVLNRAVEVIKFFQYHRFEHLHPSFELDNIYLSPEGVVKFSPVESKAMFPQLANFSCQASPKKIPMLVEENFADLSHRRSNLGQLQCLCQALMPNSIIEAEMAFQVKFMSLKTAHFDLVLPSSNLQTLTMLFPKQNEEGDVPYSALTIRSMIQNRSALWKRKISLGDQNYNSLNQSRNGLHCSDLMAISQSNMLKSKREQLTL